jgi:hypothetical protein
MGARRRLRKALDSQDLVRVRLAPKHADRLSGFVVGIGNEWALLALTMDGGYFDGYMAFRLKDIDHVRIDPGFEGRFARTQPQWPPTPPPVDLDSTEGVVTSLASSSRLIGLEKAGHRSAIWIGTLVGAGRRWTWLHEVGPDGTWEVRPLRHKTRCITNVQVDTHYLTALKQTADDQPDLGLQLL